MGKFSSCVGRAKRVEGGNGCRAVFAAHTRMYVNPAPPPKNIIIMAIISVILAVAIPDGMGCSEGL
jgi:hypothetical protein